MAFKVCIDGYKETRKECAKWRDDGYSECTNWSKNCVDWARECVVEWLPILGPAFCKVAEWVCRGFRWVCTAAVWVAHVVCHAWNVVTTFVCLAWETVLVVSSVVGILIKFILALPVIGAIIRQIVNLVTGIVLGIVGFVIEGIACGLLGICAPKKLRLCLTFNRDADRTRALAILDRAKEILKDEANVTVYAEVSDGRRMTSVRPECGAGAWWQDFGETGSEYEKAATLACREYTVASIVGLASPIYAFAVADVKGSYNGCSLGPLTNYVVFETNGSCNTHLAHEIGHACNLTHPISTDPANLMHKQCVSPGRDQLSRLQKSILRGSKYVTYF